MVDPTLVGIGALVIVAAGAAAYHYLTGDAVSVDVDDDDEPDFSFEENEEGEDETVEDLVIEAAPDVAREIGGELAEVRGLGPAKAEDLSRNGFHTAQDLYFAADEELLDVSGIGPSTLEQIRAHLGSSDE